VTFLEIFAYLPFFAFFTGFPSHWRFSSGTPFAHTPHQAFHRRSKFFYRSFWPGFGFNFQFNLKGIFEGGWWRSFSNSFFQNYVRFKHLTKNVEEIKK